MKVKELMKQIETDGWFQVRMRGSHRQYKHQTKPGAVTVSGKPNLDVPPRSLSENRHFFSGQGIFKKIAQPYK